MFDRASPRALRAFVEVARQGSVARAAQLLHISPSAVSHLLRELEAALGVPLFEPGSRRTTLTDAGEQLRWKIGGAFDAIERAVSDLTRRRGEVRLSTLSTFAMLWLVPRLPRMQAALPDVRVMVSTDTRPVDLATEPFDCAIRWGRGNWRGLVQAPLFRETLIAVAGPGLLAGRTLPATAEELLRLPRVAAKSRPDDWRLLLAAMEGGASALFDEPGLVFETRALAVRAAIAGVGVAVIDRPLVADALRLGHLMQAAPVAADRPEGHFFVARQQALRDRELCLFRDWLVSEAEGAHDSA